MYIVSKALSSVGFATTGKLYIGGDGVNYLDAIMQELRLWNRQLSIEEFGYSNPINLPANTTNIVAHWPMDERRGKGFIDREGIFDAYLEMGGCEELAAKINPVCTQCEEFKEDFTAPTTWKFYPIGADFRWEARGVEGTTIEENAINVTEPGQYLMANLDNAVDGQSTYALGGCIDLSNAIDPRLTFDVHTAGAAGGVNVQVRRIEIDNNGYGPWTTVVAVGFGGGVGDWKLKLVNLSDFIGSRIQYRFEAYATTGETKNWVAIDDVKFVKDASVSYYNIKLDRYPYQHWQGFEESPTNFRDGWQIGGVSNKATIMNWEITDSEETDGPSNGAFEGSNYVWANFNKERPYNYDPQYHSFETSLESPKLDLTEASAAYLSFKYFIASGTSANLYVDYRIDPDTPGTEWQYLGQYSTTSSWQGGLPIQLPTACLGKIVRVRIVAVSTSAYPQGVMALDDIRFWKESSIPASCGKLVSNVTEYELTFNEGVAPNWENRGYIPWTVVDEVNGSNEGYLVADIGGYNQGDEAVILTPCLDWTRNNSGFPAIYVNIDYTLNTYNTTLQEIVYNNAKLVVEARKSDEASWQRVDIRDFGGHQGLALSDYLGHIFQLRFVVKVNDGLYNAPTEKVAINLFKALMLSGYQPTCSTNWYESGCIVDEVPPFCEIDQTKMVHILTTMGFYEPFSFTDIEAQCRAEKQALIEKEQEIRAQEIRDAYADKFLRAYYNDCFKEPFTESFTYTFQPQEYDYTLYYYDAAGSLVQTVPPEGVRFAAKGDDYANHELKTRYAYNTTGGIVWQNTPDGGTSRMFYDPIGRVRLSQDARQATAKHFSYTKYDEQGRLAEVGQLEKKADGSELVEAELLVALEDFKHTSFPLATNYQLDQRTITYYDKLPSEGLHNDGGFTLIEGQNLRGRVVASELVESGETMANASLYSYDVHGNVDLMQTLSLHERKIRYDYDLISGNVNHVIYQPDAPKEFIHRYTYDADNRIVEVQTSLDRYIWATEAHYYYYAHGPLARTELGEYKVQGLDYAYTLQGWIKNVNTPGQNPEEDLGKDATENSYVSKDIVAYQLGYFSGDYTPIGPNTAERLMAPRLWGQFEVVEHAHYKNTAEVPYITNATDFIRASDDVNLGNGVDYDFKAGNVIDLESGFEANGNNFNASIGAISTTGAGRSLYNGNIAWMVTDLGYFGQSGIQAMAYRYDQLNRIKRGESYRHDGTSWIKPNKAYDVAYSYDANGNLQTLQRHNGAGSLMDDLAYSYDATLKNRLLHVADGVGNVTGNDFEDQGDGNYQYDEIGNLIADASEKIDDIEWTLNGKVKRVKKRNGADEEVEVVYTYDVAGNRSSKRVYVAGATQATKQTFYFRDASGNMMETENIREVEEGINEIRTEMAIYGSSRLGYYRSLELIPADETEAKQNRLGQLTLGNKQYELSNHLGNVLTVISDRKLGMKDASGNLVLDTEGLIATFVADVLSVNDYYPFGLTMEGRKFESETYRYGFNGKEDDTDFGNKQVIQDYGFRLYNPSIAKFLSVDPLAPQFPFLTPYQFAANRPILSIDLDGLESKSTNGEEPNENEKSSLPNGGAIVDPERFLKTYIPMPKTVIRKTRPSIDKSPTRNGFQARGNANISPIDHALNQPGSNRSPYISASSRQFGFSWKWFKKNGLNSLVGSANIKGTPYWITVGSHKKSGGLLISNAELIKHADELIANNSKFGPRLDIWKGNQGLFGIEREVLLKGDVPKLSVEGPLARALRYGGRGLQIYGMTMTVKDMTLATQKSIEKGSYKPVLAEGIRQGGSWALAVGGAKLGAGLGGAGGSITGPGAFVTATLGGIIGGGIGYFAGDLIADQIDEN